MFIKLKKEPFYYSYGSSSGYMGRLQDQILINRWLKVDPKFLFCDQVNTYSSESFPEGARIHLRNVDKIVGDLRPYYRICRWCHHKTSKRKTVCGNCGRDDMLEVLCVDKIECA